MVYSSEKIPPIVVPETVENLAEMEEASETETYLMLSELGCELGPQFQVIKKLYIGKNECLAKVQWDGNLITFVEALFKVVVIFKSYEKEILLTPTAFNRLAVDVPLLMNLPPGSKIDVRYLSWSNMVVCKGAELLGISLSPAVHAETSRLVWSELTFQPYFDDKITAEEFLSYSVQTAAEDRFLSWGTQPCTVDVMVIRTDDESCSQYTQMLKSDFTCRRSNVELKISQVDLEKAKEQASQVGRRENLIVAGEYGTMASLVRHCGEKLFCITYFSTNGTPKYDHTLRPISVSQTESGKLALLKKVPSQGKIQVCKIQSPEWLSDLRRFVAEDKTESTIIAVTNNLSPRQVLPTLSSEPYAHRIRTVIILDRDAPQFSLTNSFYSSQLALGLSVNILSGGTWGSLRTTALQVSPRNFNLDSLITSSNQNLAINCVGLNTTTFTFNCEISTEEPELKYVDYSGIQKGQRVMGVAYFDSDSNALCPDSTLTWPVPVEWTMEDAVTVPVLYTLAYYCINFKAKVEAGEHVLVHAGTSALGQAIIAVALQSGAEVLASVMDEEEALILAEMFPNLRRSQVFVIDKEDVRVAVRRRLEGKGVEVIVNFFQGHLFQSTLGAAGTDCRILHLAEIKVEDRETIGLQCFFSNRSAYGITLNNIKGCSEEWKMDLRKTIKNGIKHGVVKPLKKKRLFRLRDFSDAIQNLKINNATEKTVLISKYEDQILPLNGYFQCDFNNLHIIAGENVELKFELAEWLVHHGAKKLILLNDEESKGAHYLKRVNRILYRNKCSTVISPSSRLDTVDSALQFLKETLRIGTVSSIFCVCMDENSNKMKNLESASRQLIPRLQQFVSLLGTGSAVCDARASSGLPACSIKSDGSLESPQKIIPYLFSLLADTQAKAKFFFVSDGYSTAKTQEELESLSYLPNSVEELYALGGCVEAQPIFAEEVTRSPGYSVVKYSLLPVFVIPGLGRHWLRSLLRQLMHPAFCCGLPADAQRMENLAQSLVENIMQIQPRGPYNILGESWGGALALAIARLLEDQGHRVNLILIQGIPTVAQSRLRALCRKYEADLETSILNVALNGQAKDIGHISWREKFAQLLQTMEPDVRETVARAVPALNNQLTSLLQFKPSKKLFKGTVTLIRNKTQLMYDLENLAKFCQESPVTVTVEENNHSQLLASFTTANAINENLDFEWRP